MNPQQLDSEPKVHLQQGSPPLKGPRPPAVMGLSQSVWGDPKKRELTQHPKRQEVLRSPGETPAGCSHVPPRPSSGPLASDAALIPGQDAN